MTECYRCRKLGQDFDSWYAEYLRDLDEGHLCSRCQAANEQMEARLNEAIVSSDALEPFGVIMTAITRVRQDDQSEPSTFQDLTGMLLRSCATPEAMRSEAARLESLAGAFVSLMRRTADEVAVSNRRWDNR